MVQRGSPVAGLAQLAKTGPRLSCRAPPSCCNGGVYLLDPPRFDAHRLPLILGGSRACFGYTEQSPPKLLARPP